MRLVFFDLETGGLDYTKHPITQIAAIAVDADLREIDSFQAKLDFDRNAADPRALDIGRYSPEIWTAEQKPCSAVCAELAKFLAKYADIRMISQRNGSEYWVAQLVGYNATTFDGPFLQALYRNHQCFLPAAFGVLCVMQRAMWRFIELDSRRPENMKLATVCRHFGIDLTDAHDAMADCRATLALYRRVSAPA